MAASFIIVGVCLFLAHRIWLILYHLYWSPLASFPGPKFAAASYLPELYYNLIVGEGGQFPIIVRKWHDEYGPIIRINPHELHVRDASWFDTLYNNSQPAWKIKNFGERFALELSTAGTADPAIFRPRRAALNPFFSRRKVAQEAPRFQQNAAKALRKVEDGYVHTGDILKLSRMWGCYAADNLIDMCFDQDSGMLESPGFYAAANEAMEKLVESVHVFYHFPYLMVLMLRIPDAVLLRLNPWVAPLLNFWDSLSASVSRVLSISSSAEQDKDRTVFGSLLRQDLPEAERSHNRLFHEAKSIIGAGVETVARSLSLACFHILNQPVIRERLTAELQQAAPDPSIIPDWDTLTKLPYLSACVEEALRLTYGVVQRRARAFHHGPLRYRDWTIPPGTFVGMNNWDVSHDEAIFPDSHSFVPERWLDEPRAPDGRPLSAYQVGFGKGSRSCIGVQVAYAELHIGLANFFRWPRAPRAVLYETDLSDVEMARDQFVPRAPRRSQGVRVIFTSD